LLLLRL
jgi:hypothetical protein